MKLAVGVDANNQPIKASIKHIYNNADTFKLNPVSTGLFKKFILGGIIGWDKQDSSIEWDSKGQKDLANLFVNDFLVVDTQKICAYNVKSFLDIEKSVDGSYTSCGGRTPSEDIIDTLASFLVGGPKASKEAHGDGVTRTMNPPTKNTPYFAEPFIMPAQK